MPRRASIFRRLSSVQGPQDAGAEFDLLRLYPHIPQRLPDVGGVGGGAAEDIALKILEDLDLALGVAGGDGDGHRPQGLGPVVQPHPPGEQPVAVGDMDLAFGGAAGGHDGPGGAVPPDVDVVLGVPRHDLLAGGAGGGVELHYLGHGGGEEAVGVGVPQVLLVGEGQLRQVS